MIDILIISFLFGLSGFAWSHILTAGGDLFDWVPLLLGHVTENEKAHKLFYACEACVAGQLAFWFYLLSSLAHQSYRLSEHLWITLASIAFARIIYKIYDRA